MNDNKGGVSFDAHYYIKIDKNNQVNGEGLRCVLWLSGCENHCKGCQNPETWSYTFGKVFDTDAFNEITAQLADDVIDGITFTGGDPMSPRNRGFTAVLAAKIKSLYPTKTIWCYSGHLYQDIEPEFLQDIDVLIDGKFEMDKYNPKLRWRGSSNQRVIDVKSSLKMNEIIPYRERFNGKTVVENDSIFASK